jgi:ribonuclease P protein component
MQRPYRLRHPADFERLRHEGQRWHHPLAVLVTGANNQPISRFAFLASRRVGKAVARNRARRLLREAVRLKLDDIQRGWDCLFIARRDTPGASYQEVEAAVGQLLGRAGLLLLANGEPPAAADGSAVRSQV